MEIYEGYNDKEFEKIVRLSTSQGRLSTIERSPSLKDKILSSRTGSTSSFGYRPQSSSSRPMSSVKPVGYSYNAGIKTPENFFNDHFSTLMNKQKHQLQILRDTEKEIEKDLFECYKLSRSNDYKPALKLAKSIFEKEKSLAKRFEKYQEQDRINLDLKGLVLFNLASRFSDCNFTSNALRIYERIIDNNLIPFAGRLYVNIGNIQVKKREYLLALKNYHKAYDEISPVYSHLKYPEAIKTYSEVLSMNNQSTSASLNLFICYSQCCLMDKMKQVFKHFIESTRETGTDSLYDETHTDSEEETFHFIKNKVRFDGLKELESQRMANYHQALIKMGKIFQLISSNEKDMNLMSWCVDLVRSQNLREVYEALELFRINHSFQYGRIDLGIKLLQDVEESEEKLSANMANVLSYIYLLRGNIKRADEMADIALYADRYSYSACINKANVFFKLEDYTQAVEYYQDALCIYSQSTEANYNLGLAYLELGKLENALEQFNRLSCETKGNPILEYNILKIYQKMNDEDKIIQKFHELINVTQGNSVILSEFGDFLTSNGDPEAAQKYYIQAHNNDPALLEPIKMIGTFNYRQKNYKLAEEFFLKASKIESNDVSWYLLIASCQKKLNKREAAIDTYLKAYEKFPENLSCLRYLLKYGSDKLSPDERDELIQKMDVLRRQEADKDNHEEDDVEQMKKSPKFKSRQANKSGDVISNDSKSQKES